MRTRVLPFGWVGACVVIGCSSASSGVPPSSTPPPGDDASTNPLGDASPPHGDGAHPMPDASGDTAPNPGDASMGTDAGSDTPAGCGEFAGDMSFTCAKDGNSRGECLGGTPTIEACPRGCLREPAPQDSICMGTTDNWSCPGSYGMDRALNGDYDLTSFGCWIDANNQVHTDPGDNCIPSCLSQAQATGLCDPADTGPQCEEKINWYTADGARFGCLQRVRVTNPANGKVVIAVALDFGPACSVEATVSKAVLDASGRVNQYLFGGDQGVSDMSNVHVVEVDNATPLGPM